MEQHRSLTLLADISAQLLDRRRPVEVMSRVCQLVSEHMSASLVLGMVVQEETPNGLLIGLEGQSRGEVLNVELLSRMLSDDGMADQGLVQPDSTLGLCIDEFVDIPQGTVLFYGKAAVVPGVSVWMVAVQESSEEDEVTMALLAAVSRVVALGLRDTSLVTRLKEQTRRVRRPNSSGQVLDFDVLTRYKELFAVVSDGVILVDRKGRIVYVNQVAESLTGFASSWMLGRNVVEIVLEEDREGLQTAVALVAGGKLLSAFDLDMKTTSRDMIRVRMSPALLPGGNGLVALTFRDMTETAVVEHELLRTKDFLERLIDSTVDAILYVDSEGMVQLFNSGAEALFEYASEDVIGRIMLEDLFPPGEADKLLKQLHGPRKGGVGRLEPIECEVLTRDGDRKHVRLTAAVQEEDGEGEGVVFIISDMTEAVRLKEQYQRVQERLLEREKQSLITQLAGTTAHELNQPLTSILGYSQLIKRRLPEDDPNQKAVDVIMSEAERMAEIVRKIGRITRFETTSYVGNAEILDLDKSSS